MTDKTSLFYESTNSLLDILHNKADPSTKVENYKALLEIPKWFEFPALRKAAAKYIAEYSRYFPQLYELAIDAQLDLCEDEDIQIRKESVRNLPIFCQHNSQYAQRIADVLLQLLQAEIPEELDVVTQSLLGLFHKYPRQVLDAIVHRLLQNIGQVREAILQLLLNSWTKLPQTPQIQQEILNALAQSLQTENISEVEFGHVIRLLSSHDALNTPERLSGIMEALNGFVDSFELKTSLSGDEQMQQITSLANGYFVMMKKRQSGLRLVHKLICDVINNPIFYQTFDTADQSRVFRIICEFLSVSVVGVGPQHIGNLLSALETILADYNDQTSPTDVDYLKIEPLLYVAYSLSFKNSKECEGNLMSLCRVILLKSQLAKDLYAKDLAQIKASGVINEVEAVTKNKLYLASLNIHSLIKEFLKPAKARSPVPVHLSWKPVPSPEEKHPTQAPQKPAGPEKRKAASQEDVSPAKKAKPAGPQHLKDTKQAKGQHNASHQQQHQYVQHMQPGKAQKGKQAQAHKQTQHVPKTDMRKTLDTKNKVTKKQGGQTLQPVKLHQAVKNQQGQRTQQKIKAAAPAAIAPGGPSKRGPSVSLLAPVIAGRLVTVSPTAAAVKASFAVSAPAKKAAQPTTTTRRVVIRR